MKQLKLLVIFLIVLVVLVDGCKNDTSQYYFTDMLESFANETKIAPESINLDGWIGHFSFIERGEHISTPEDPIDHESIYYSFEVYRKNDMYFSDSLRQCRRPEQPGRRLHCPSAGQL